VEDEIMDIDKEKYRKNRIVPTRLRYKDRYPTNSKYKTPDFIKSLKEEKEFSEKKRKKKKMSEKEFFKVKLRGEIIVHCEKEEVESFVYHDIINDNENIIKIEECKKITREEAYE
jgi:hypothetical protein